MTAAEPTDDAATTTSRPSAGSPGPFTVDGGLGDRRTPGLAELGQILAGPIPYWLPSRPRMLGCRLREDDTLARRIWSHPVFSALVVWAMSYHPAADEAWEEMAVYALARWSQLQAGRLSTAEIRTGMINTARWVNRRGRHGERIDPCAPLCQLDEIVAPPLVTASGDRWDEEGTLGVHRHDVDGYLATALQRELPAVTGAVIDETWWIAREHYARLVEVTGLQGEALLAAAQSRSGVNRSRRLVNRLPGDWPPATRKAAGLLFTGSPAFGAGLLVWWATTEPGDVPVEVRRRWNGLLAVIDPEIGTLSEGSRRRHRELAQRWTPDAHAETPRIAV